MRNMAQSGQLELADDIGGTAGAGTKRSSENTEKREKETTKKEKKEEIILPVKGCCVKHKQSGQDGLVVDSEGTTVQVRWGSTETISNIHISELSSGFKVGMYLQEVPCSAIRKSLGTG